MRDIFCDVHVLKNIDQLKGEINLKEEDTGQSIIIGGIPENAVLLKLDVDKKGYKKRSAYLRSSCEFIHQGCDYCLILPDFSQAFLFELKSQRPKGYADQFVAAELFIEYCCNLWNKLQCNNTSLVFTRILLSPHFNSTSGDIIKLTKPDRCNNDIEILTPGFPNRIRLERFL